MNLLLALLGLAFSMLKGTLQSMVLLYPSYKTYKALESRRLRAAQGMLVYWCIFGVVTSMKEFADEIMGKWSNFFVWKISVTVLRLVPLIMGPDRLYHILVAPFFAAHEAEVDTVVEKAREVRTKAKEAVPAMKEEGVVAGASHAAHKVADLLQEDGEQLVHTIVERTEEVKHAIEDKTAKIGLTWDERGIGGLFAAFIREFEVARDASVEYLSRQWIKHGPVIKKNGSKWANNAKQAYMSKAPIVKERVRGAIVPRVQPLVQKVDGSVRPFVRRQSERVQQLWVRHGGPVRNLWLNRIEPMWSTRIEPWIMHSFLPAVRETIVVVWHMIMDKLNPPPEHVRVRRAENRKRRREEHEAKAQWKRRGLRKKESGKEERKQETATARAGEEKSDESVVAERPSEGVTEAPSADIGLRHRESATTGGRRHSGISRRQHRAASRERESEESSKVDEERMVEKAKLGQQAEKPQRLAQETVPQQYKEQPQPASTAEKQAEIVERLKGADRTASMSADEQAPAESAELEKSPTDPKERRDLHRALEEAEEAAAVAATSAPAASTAAKPADVDEEKVNESGADIRSHEEKKQQSGKKQTAAHQSEAKSQTIEHETVEGSSSAGNKHAYGGSGGENKKQRWQPKHTEAGTEGGEKKGHAGAAWEGEPSTTRATQQVQ